MSDPRSYGPDPLNQAAYLAESGRSQEAQVWAYLAIAEYLKDIRNLIEKIYDEDNQAIRIVSLR